MSANTPAAAPAKSKKMLLIIIGVVVAVLVIGGGAAAWFISSRSHAAEDEEGGGAPAAHKESPKVAPTFLPMENMVVNLADPGGDRFAQIGIRVGFVGCHVPATGHRGCNAQLGCTTLSMYFPWRCFRESLGEFVDACLSI